MVTAARLEVDSPAWAFCLDLYRSPGVAEECVGLQDKFDVDVSLLLVALWVGLERGMCLDAADVGAMEAYVARWRDGAVRPLRAIRRGLKSLPEMARPELAGLRARVQSAEIEAERLEIALLYEWSRSRPVTEDGSIGAALENLHRIAGENDVPAITAALSAWTRQGG